MTTTTVADLHGHATVGMAVEEAFAFFTESIGRWWPNEYHIGSPAMVDTILEPQPGGRWYERGEDGSECDWGRVLTWEPPHRIVLTWQINGSWPRPRPGQRDRSPVHPRRTPTDPGRTPTPTPRSAHRRPDHARRHRTSRRRLVLRPPALRRSGSPLRFGRHSLTPPECEHRRMNPRQTAEHWDRAHAKGDRALSWFQRYPDASLRMLDASGINADHSVIDIGGGASVLADALLERGHTDLTVLDVSAAALRISQRRLGPTEHVQWIVADLLTWTPPRTYAAWHDRAVFHFITAEQDQRRYLTTLTAATSAGSVAVFGCFAPDGPDSCSGLPVVQYGAGDLAATLGDDWTLVATDREEHHTPSGAIQPFTWATFRRQPSRRLSP